MLSLQPISPTKSFPSDSQMCRFPISPFKSKQRFNHERHGSESIQRPRPLSMATSSSTMQHSKRASIYVSDASLILAHRTPLVSPTSSHDSLLSPGNEASDFVDYYSILELEQLGPRALDDDITSSFRRLRTVYFQSDAKKYKALTAAFDVLRDPDARQAYDQSYHAHAAALSSLSSIGEVIEQAKHERKDSGTGDDAAKLAILREEEELEAMRSLDPNWALKHHQRLHEPLIGTVPYQSWVPISEAYYSNRLPKCARPSYVGFLARNSLPN